MGYTYGWYESRLQRFDKRGFVIQRNIASNWDSIVLAKPYFLDRRHFGQNLETETTYFIHGLHPWLIYVAPSVLWLNEICNPKKHDLQLKFNRFGETILSRLTPFRPKHGNGNNLSAPWATPMAIINRAFSAMISADIGSALSALIKGDLWSKETPPHNWDSIVLAKLYFLDWRHLGQNPETEINYLNHGLHPWLV